MQEFLSKMIGRRVDVVCSGAASVSGEVLKVESGVLHMKDDDHICYIAVDKVVVVWEARDDAPRAGFVSAALK